MTLGIVDYPEKMPELASNERILSKDWETSTTILKWRTIQKTLRTTTAEDSQANLT